MLDFVDQLFTSAAAAMCSGLDVTDTTHERSGSTTVVIRHVDISKRQECVHGTIPLNVVRS